MSFNEKRWIIFSLVMLVMPLLNTRTGIILSAVGIIIAIVYYSSGKNRIKYIWGLLIGIPIIFAVFSLMPEYNKGVITRGYREIIQFFKGDHSVSILNQLFIEDVIFPQDIILGQGAMAGAFGYVGIDSGYIQSIWRYGLIGFTLFVFGFVRMCYISYKNSKYSKEQKYSIVIIMLFFFIYLLKLFSIFNFGGMAIIFTLITAINVENYGNSNVLERSLLCRRTQLSIQK